MFKNIFFLQVHISFLNYRTAAYTRIKTQLSPSVNFRDKKTTNQPGSKEIIIK